MATKSRTRAEQSGTLASVSGDPEIAQRNALALVPTRGTVSQRLAALQEMLETPYVSIRAAAENATVVTILRAGENAIESLQTPGEMVDQYVYLCQLQTPLDYIDTQGVVHEHAAGERVMLGFTRTPQRGERATPRDMYYAMFKEATDDGETCPNLELTFHPSKVEGHSPAVKFNQLFPENPGATIGVDA